MSEVSYDPESHYDRVTDAWGLLLGDELHYGLFTTGTETLSEATRALTDQMIAACTIEQGTTILDVGCGTGGPACYLATLGATVVGITTSAVGVAAATGRAEAAGVADRVSFELRDGMENGFPDESFDRMWVLESSHLMRERGRLIAECARTLRRGGRLALCDVMLRRPMPFEEVRELRRPLGLLREVFGDARMEELATYVALAEQHGLVVDIADDLSDAAHLTFARWRENAAANHDAVSAKLGEGDWQQFIDACGVLEQLWDSGVFGYGLLAASKP